jgi:hypothetical protein
MVCTFPAQTGQTARPCSAPCLASRPPMWPTPFKSLALAFTYALMARSSVARRVSSNLGAPPRDRRPQLTRRKPVLAGGNAIPPLRSGVPRLRSVIPREEWPAGAEVQLAGAQVRLRRGQGRPRGAEAQLAGAEAQLAGAEAQLAGAEARLAGAAESLAGGSAPLAGADFLFLEATGQSDGRVVGTVCDSEKGSLSTPYQPSMERQEQWLSHSVTKRFAQFASS